jgi:endoglucanase
LAAIKKSLFTAADEISKRTAKAPYCNSLSRSNYIWGSNSVALNYSVLLLFADRLAPKKAWRDAAFDNLHYVLGRNAFGVCWVTGLGTNPFLHPHHRPTAACSGGRAWPGLLSGGPNAGRQDPVLSHLPADTPPALCWVDEQGSYAGNEVAINWNAPLVFVLAATLPEKL